MAGNKDSDHVSAQDKAIKEQNRLRKAYRSVFGIDKESRNEAQQIVWDDIEFAIDSPVFLVGKDGKYDALYAAHIDGHREYAMKIKKIATEPIEKVGKPEVIT